MKYSFSTLGCPSYNVDQIIDLALKNKYDGIELRAVSGTVDLATLAEFKGDGLSKTAAKIKAAGLDVVCVDTGVRFNVASKESQAKNLEQAKFSMELANAFDCGYIRTFGGPFIPLQGYDETLGWIREGYEKMCEIAQKEGILPLLETHDDFSTSARIGDILNNITAKNVGIVWDILHPFRFGEAVKDTYAALKDKIRHIHIKDSFECSPKGFDFALVGEGIVPVKECIDLLKSDGFDGYLSFESEKLWHPEIPDAEIAMPHYAKAIVEYL